MKKGLSTGQIVMLVVLAVAALPVIGFVLMVLAYATLHGGPRREAIDAEAMIDAAVTIDSGDRDP